MSGNKLNQSLDDILTERRSSTRSRAARPVGRRQRAAKVAAAPVGGVQKAAKAVKAKAGKAVEKVAAPVGPTRAGDGKIIVSNLPQDVSESQIKDYFHTTVGPVKRVLLTYGPNGQSRGVATVFFVKHESAAKAAKELDGLKVDKKPMKIELIMSAKSVPEQAPAKTLSERMDKPKPATKDKPKPATAAKVARGTATRGGRTKARGRNAGRSKPKTAEELDAEMQDYFGGDVPAAANGDAAMATNGGAVQPVANNADAGMEDQIL